MAKLLFRNNCTHHASFAQRAVYKAFNCSGHVAFLTPGRVLENVDTFNERYRVCSIACLPCACNFSSSLMVLLSQQCSEIARRVSLIFSRSL